MNSTSNASFRLLLLLLAIFTTSACAWGQNYEPLLMDGDLYQSACTSGEKEKLQGSLKSGKVQDSVELWRALEAVLCSTKDQAGRRYVAGLMPSKVREHVDSGDGQPSYELVPRSDGLITKLMAEGRAWSTTVRVEQRDAIVLQYFFNEACVRSITFRRLASKWSIYEFAADCY